jgi:hypothetical protein
MVCTSVGLGTNNIFILVRRIGARILREVPSFILLWRSAVGTNFLMDGVESMTSPYISTLAVAVILFFLTPCVGQERGGVDPSVAVPLLRSVLGASHASGSLGYWGRCDLHRPYPDFPSIRPQSDDSHLPVQILREVFASDSKMQVTEDTNGLIRMIETDVPRDLLDIKIRHISFGTANLSSDNDLFGGPNNAVRVVLSAPEVKAFRKSHNIGPFSSRWLGPGDSASKPRVIGDLYNVTLSEALDYIAQTFPGFWIYENCANQEHSGRNVFFAFFETAPPSVTASQ